MSSTTPLRASTVEPIGIASPAASGTQPAPGFAHTWTVPPTGATTTSSRNSGVGAGVGVAVGAGVGRGRGDRRSGSASASAPAAPTVNARLAGVGSGHARGSTARTANMCAPSASSPVVCGDVQGAKAPRRRGIRSSPGAARREREGRRAGRWSCPPGPTRSWSPAPGCRRRSCSPRRCAAGVSEVVAALSRCGPAPCRVGDAEEREPQLAAGGDGPAGEERCTRSPSRPGSSSCRRRRPRRGRARCRRPSR